MNALPQSQAHTQATITQAAITQATITQATTQDVTSLPEYHSILLAVDSSDHANRGLRDAIDLGQLWHTQITGAHVYAAKLHDVRFRQMEGGLPEQFREEQELERQRDVHDDLITRGLSIITDSYLDQADHHCSDAGLKFTRCSLEGKNYRQLTQETNSGNYDLLVIGALGLGAVQDSRLGTVCQRVTRRTDIDTLVVKQPACSIKQGPIVVAVDGSAKAYGGLLTALSLAKQWQVAVKVIAVFDPYFHYVAFNRIADILSEEAGKVFRFKDQEKLHEEIIDSGLAKIYQGHLAVAESIAKEHGVIIETQLLDGKPYDAIAKYVRKLNPSLLIVGKTGIHADPDLDIGGTSENILYQAPCAVLLSQREHLPHIDIVADVTTTWTNEAKKHMENVPQFVRSMARMAILRYAQEKGHTIITEKIVDEATAQLCPGHAKQAMAEIVAAHDAGMLAQPVSEQPVSEQAVSEQTSFVHETDVIRWSERAKALLLTVEDLSVRGNLCMRAEKKARQKGSVIVEKEHIKSFLREVSPGRKTCPLLSSTLGNLHEINNSDPTEPDESNSLTPKLHWQAAALAQLTRVPEGFMRDLTRQRVEQFAKHKHVTEITTDLIDEKYAEWASGSDKQNMNLIWQKDANERINRIPPFVRGMVAKEVERCAQEKGLTEVTSETISVAMSSWQGLGVFHSESSPGLYRKVGDGKAENKD